MCMILSVEADAVLVDNRQWNISYVTFLMLM